MRVDDQHGRPLGDDAPVSSANAASSRRAASERGMRKKRPAMLRRAPVSIYVTSGPNPVPA
jgi:hypothetical protein